MSNEGRRNALRGAEMEVFDLIFEILSPEQWEECVVSVLPMTERSGRGALRGAEVRILDLMFNYFTPEGWAGWLKNLLEAAAAMGYRDVTQRLVKGGAEIGDAFHRAVQGGHGDIVRDLLESGASITAKYTTTGHTPLHVAAGWGKTDLVQLLLLKGADKDALDNEEMTPLVLAGYQGHVAAAQALLAAGADANHRCREYKTPVMHVAAQEGHVEILRALIKHGADVAAVDTDGRTALHIAASFATSEAVDMLVEAGSDIEARNDNRKHPLYKASFNRSRALVLALLKHGANVNAQENRLETPLMWVASRAGTKGAAEVVDSLLRAGADETILNVDGDQAADVVGGGVQEEDSLAEDVERVRELLANAPADRAWRRRGFLVLCRSHPDRMQQQQVIGGTYHADTAPRTRRRARLARAAESGCHEAVGSDNAHKPKGVDWALLVAKVLRLQEDGLFRTIVGYL
eukprot:g6879.t1